MITNVELDELGEVEVRHRFVLGDWVDESEIRTIQRWLRKAEKEHLFLQKCERASKAHALRTIRLSYISALIALLSFIVATIALARTFT